MPRYRCSACGGTVLFFFVVCEAACARAASPRPAAPAGPVGLSGRTPKNNIQTKNDYECTAQYPTAFFVQRARLSQLSCDGVLFATDVANEVCTVTGDFFGVTNHAATLTDAWDALAGAGASGVEVSRHAEVNI